MASNLTTKLIQIHVTPGRQAYLVMPITIRPPKHRVRPPGPPQSPSSPSPSPPSHVPFPRCCFRPPGPPNTPFLAVPARVNWVNAREGDGGRGPRDHGHEPRAQPRLARRARRRLQPDPTAHRRVHELVRQGRRLSRRLRG